MLFCGNQYVLSLLTLNSEICDGILHPIQSCDFAQVHRSPVKRKYLGDVCELFCGISRLVHQMEKVMLVSLIEEDQ